MTKSATAIDIHVGLRIRMRRSILGLSQSALGEGLGVTFQQVQKYEKGTNRVNAGRLQRIAELLNVPISFFFENSPRSLQNDGLPVTTMDQPDLNSKESIALAKAFLAVNDEDIRQRVLDLIKSLGGRKEDRDIGDDELASPRP